VIIDRGSGAPLVLVPGLQGRWEYMRPAVDALSAFFRVLTFPLCGEPTCELPFDRARGLDNYTEQITAVLDRAHIERATICGVSFGGLVAARFAAAQSGRTAALVLASTPAPRWQLRPRHDLYARLPWIFGPVFLIESPWRMRAEFRAAFPEGRARRAFKRAALKTVFTAPISLARMAERARLIATIDLTAECARIAAPTLVVTGERELDHVVPVDGSSEYVRLIRGARAVVLERTGHLGTITRPHTFAALLRDFLDGQRDVVNVPSTESDGSQFPYAAARD
jgi:3-oxoadipate enol-lactonase